MISPVIFFQVVTGIIASFQIVIQPLLLSQSGQVGRVAEVPQSTHLFMVQVYEEFFSGNRYGYGSAMLWVFFLVILAITLVVQRSSRLWVHYEVNSEADR
jgi:multiple sugar transport system permease protein